jgi:hypothetical protein
VSGGGEPFGRVEIHLHLSSAHTELVPERLQNDIPSEMELGIITNHNGDDTPSVVVIFHGHHVHCVGDTGINPLHVLGWGPGLRVQAGGDGVAIWLQVMIFGWRWLLRVVGWGAT